MKTTNKACLTAILLIAVSCTKEGIKKSPAASSQSAGNSVAAHHIGERYGGGIIFYIDSTGDHGLIVDTTDLGFRSPWYNGAYTVTGATATRLGSGKMNTQKIILSQGDSGRRYAAYRCAHSRKSGYTDWVLPSKNELNELFKHHWVINYQNDSYYWSSTEYSKNEAWVQHLVDGNQTPYSKEIRWAVRAIRYF